MNPQNRRLRLYRTTVRGLNPETATAAKGGIDLDDTGMICSLFECPPNPETKAFTNCPYCPPPNYTLALNCYTRIDYSCPTHCNEPACW